MVECIKEFLAYVLNQFSVHVKKIRSDNGKEFLNNELRIFL